MNMLDIPSLMAGVAADTLSGATAEKYKIASQTKYGFVQRPGFNYPFLTPKRVAELLGVSVKTLERMRKDGSGPPFKKIGKKHIRYSVVELDAWWAAKNNSGSL
jgi:excisionase family DNA binding protein